MAGILTKIFVHVTNGNRKTL